MIHMKSLIRRLDCVPWLLAACALVWAGEATAQITLSLDKYEINERQGKDGASVDLVVTAKASAKAADSDAFIELSLVPGADDAAANARISVGALDRLKIAKGADSGSLTLKIFPNDDTNNDTNMDVVINGAFVRGGGFDATTGAVSPTTFRLTDDDGASTRIRLSVDKQDLKDEGDAMDIKVTATLDGLKITSVGDATATPPVDASDREVKFQLEPVELTAAVLSGLTAGNDFLVGEYGQLFEATPQPGFAKRDQHFDVLGGFKTVTIAKNKVSGEATLKIDPRAFADDEAGPLYIMIGAREADANSSIANAGNIATAGQVATDATNLTILPALIKITKGDVAQVKSIVAIPSGRDSDMLRESDPETTIQLLVTLENAAGDEGQPVAVTIADSTDNRDTDYQARLGPSLKVEAGKTTGVVEVTVTPVDDDNKADAKFGVVASIPGRSRDEKVETITIVDEDKDTSSISLTGRVMVEGRDDLVLYEEDGEVTIEITATVNGKPLAEAAAVALTLSAAGDAKGGTAIRDVDYELTSHTFVIPAEAPSAKTEIIIIPEDDADTDDETIILGDLNAKAGKGDAPATDLDPAVAVGTLTITLKGGADPDAPAEEDAEEDAEEEPALALVDEETDVAGTVGEELSKDLPEVTGTSVNEDSEVEYLLSGTPPDGLKFSAEDLTISGTPTTPTDEEGVEVKYIALVNGTNISKTYTITISEKPAPEVSLEKIETSHNSIAEEGGEVTITLTVTLAEAAGADGEDVSLSIVAPTEGKAAMRDVDFDATLQGSISIEEGATSGTASLSVTPRDDQTGDGHKAFGVRAESSSGHTAFVNIGISDNESDSQGIVLSVNPDEVSGGTETEVTVTVSLDGLAKDSDVTVSLSIGSGSSAKRDVDYSAVFDGEVTIPADNRESSTTVTITAADNEAGKKTIVLVGSADGLGMGTASITLVEGMMAGDDDMAGDDGEGAGDDDMAGDDGEGDDGMMAGLHFTEEVTAPAYTAGTAITDLVLPEAMGGDGDITYQVFGLPAGLTFDAATRTISGTPEAAGVSEVNYLATDSAGEDEALQFSITVNPALSFGDLFGSAKIVPDSHGLTEIREFVIGQRVEGLTLPEGTGGTAPLTYSLSPALPAGLTFDAITRTIAGTPRAASETVYTYTVTDANGAIASLALQTLPAAFSLADNFPNPFNPATTIQYALPQAADVELTVYNVLGQPIRTLVAEHQNAGRYVVEWDATNDSGHSLSSGMYFYRLQAGGEFHEVKKMLLLK